MTKIKKILLGALMIVVVPVSAAIAKPSLRDVAEVENILFAAGLAYELSEKCDSLLARRFKGIRMAWMLRNRANELGYSDREIRAYVESDAEKARMRKKVETFLRSKGVDYSKPETFCSFGRAEIANSSAIGALLKAK